MTGRVIFWRNRKIPATPLEFRTVALLYHVEAATWSQGLSAPVEAHALRHELDDAFRGRQEAKK